MNARRIAILTLLSATLTVPPRMLAADSAANLKPLDFEVRVRAPLAEVWKAWTTNAGLEKWFARKANVELRSGGPFEILFLPDASPGQRGAEGLKVINYLPGELLSFEWNAPPQFPRARAQRTWVIVRLADLGDGTVRVRLTQEGFAERAAQLPDLKEEFEKTREYFSKAWPFVLESLRKHFEKTAGENATSQVTEQVVDAPLGEVWAALVTKSGREAWNVAHCEIDLKVGGRMRTHYDPKGVLGDEDSIENTILAFDPMRMITIQVAKAPAKFPFRDSVKRIWHVLTLEDAGPGRTRVRVAGLGYGSDEESQKMRKFFAAGNADTMKKLQSHFTSKAEASSAPRGN